MAIPLNKTATASYPRILGIRYDPAAFTLPDSTRAAWDWEANAPGEWMSLDARDDLIVEGVGSVTPESLTTARQRGSVVAVWVTGPREERKERALSRDPYYAEWFEVWEDQEKEHFAELEAAGIEFDVHWDWTPAQD